MHASTEVYNNNLKSGTCMHALCLAGPATIEDIHDACQVDPTEFIL